MSYALGDRRLAILPIHIEEQMFLKVNRYFWNELLFIEMCKKADRGEEVS